KKRVEIVPKINQILSRWDAGKIHSLKWLVEQGLGRDFVQSWAYRYYKQGVLRKVGPGTYRLNNTPLLWEAAIHFLQEELGKRFHICGKSALELQGSSHFVPVAGKGVLHLVSYCRDKNPSWFVDIDFGTDFQFKNSNLFPRDFFEGDYRERLLETHEGPFDLTVKISCRELAILELFHSINFEQDFESGKDYLEGLFRLRSEILQVLLESCNSIRVKRIFLYLSEKLHKDDYFANLDFSKIDLGKGKRQVFRGDSQFDRKYQITVPREEGECPF
ncbi:MAG: type IV toxin-antitoxin system AbiEi family antitoxin domain-containing protein, partial [Bacteriovoracales bacterium]|nr:type IV toxin-antitoxin system AbiEi family antitoxin domain-containing protein [Bacteriovoracales bacterium]